MGIESRYPIAICQAGINKKTRMKGAAAEQYYIEIFLARIIESKPQGSTVKVTETEHSSCIDRVESDRTVFSLRIKSHKYNVGQPLWE